MIMTELTEREMIMHKGQQKIMGLARKALAEQERKEKSVGVCEELMAALKSLAGAADSVLNDETDASEYLETEMVRANDIIERAENA